MLRLPPFRISCPGALAEAVALKAELGSEAAYVAGGTDLLPKMKRGQQTPSVLIPLRGLAELRRSGRLDGELSLGAGVTLEEVAASAGLRRDVPALARAAAGVATPLLRRTATLGGNLCLDTRCNFYDQTQPWRKSIGFCMKKDGDVCWVAPSSPRCWAVQSSDTAPVVVALEARIELEGPRGSRVVPAEDFYRHDGIRYLEKDEDEVVRALLVPLRARARSIYLKVSRRASFDFPVLGVAAVVERPGPAAPVERARLVLGALGSAPVVVEEASEVLVGRALTEDRIEEVAEAAWRRARPLDNTDPSRRWRKTVVRAYVARALGALNEAAD